MQTLVSLKETLFIENSEFEPMLDVLDMLTLYWMCWMLDLGFDMLDALLRDLI